MCQQDAASRPTVSGQAEAVEYDEPFPWDAGVFDAHCHPTDTMASIAKIAGMKARALTVMATRSQDQNLVTSVASDHGIRNRSALSETEDMNATSDSGSGKVIPAFGWHPWFSHLLYDDSLPPQEATFKPSEDDIGNEKQRHFSAVLAPAPDAAFVASLPDPQPLSGFVEATRRRLEAHNHALVGEVGLDRAFRLPRAWESPAVEGENMAREDGLTPGGREGRLLSPYRVKPEHQIAVLTAQLRLAGQVGCAVSVHGVQAHGILFDALASLWKGHEKEVVSRRKQKRVAPGAEDFSDDESAPWSDSEGEDQGKIPRTRKYEPRPFPPRICLHSFSAPVAVLKQYLNPAIPARIYFSFSSVINLSTVGGASKFPEVLRACPDDQILVESDLHTAGEDMDRFLEEMYRKICEIKGWELRSGVERIRRNYEQFVFG